MKTLILTAAILFGATITAQAQNPWFGAADSGRSAELRGVGQVLRGHAAELEALGEFQQRTQDAYGEYLDNIDKRIRLRWAIEDDAKARRDAKPDYIDRLEARLSMAERRAAIEKRKQGLIDKGILSPNPKSGIVHNGVRYKSYAEFKASPEYASMLIKAYVRTAEWEAEEVAQKERYRKAVAFGRMWAKMGWVAREKYSSLSPKQRAQSLAEFENPELKWQRLEDDSNRRFYQSRPHLIPRAGTGGLPPLPSYWKK